MKIKKIEEVWAFLEAINKCKGKVELSSIDGDVFNLKSKLTQYVAIAALLNDESEKLELFCENKEDERILYKFFSENPEIM